MAEANSADCVYGRECVARTKAATERPVESARCRRVRKRYIRVGVLRKPSRCGRGSGRDGFRDVGSEGAVGHVG